MTRVRPLLYVIALTVLSHAGFVGARVATSLLAIHEQASPFTVGVLMSLFAILPMVLGVWGGRMVDRTGIARPLLLSSAALMAGIVLPALWPGLVALHFSAVIVGLAFMIQHIALNHLIGMIGDPARRAENFSWLALGYAVSGTLGPLIAGFGIDWVGFRTAFLASAVVAGASFALLLWRMPPAAKAHAPRADAANTRALDLLREPRLRAVMFYSSLIATGWDLFLFVVPIYGTNIGLSASAIGIVMSAFAAATFTVRLVMPVIARRANEWTVVFAALLISGVAYVLFPLMGSAGTLVALSYFLGIGLGCAQPMIMAVLYAASPPGRQAEAIGLRSVVQNASHTFLPLLSGALGTAVGLNPVFWAMAGLLVLGAWVARGERGRERARRNPPSAP